MDQDTAGPGLVTSGDTGADTRCHNMPHLATILQTSLLTQIVKIAQFSSAHTLSFSDFLIHGQIQT